MNFFKNRPAQIAMLQAATENSKAAVDVIDLIDSHPELKDQPGVTGKINRLCDAVRELIDLAAGNRVAVESAFRRIAAKAVESNAKQLAELKNAPRRKKTDADLQTHLEDKVIRPEFGPDKPPRPGFDIPDALLPGGRSRKGFPRNTESGRPQ